MRAGGKLELTPVGYWILKTLRASFHEIDRVVDDVDMRINRHGKIVVSTLASFATFWLAPRLEGFFRQHPGIEISIETTARMVDPAHEGVDVAIRYGEGHVSLSRSTSILWPRILPIVSAAHPLAWAANPRPEDCIGIPLLHDAAMRDWPCWLAAHGIERDLQPAPRRFVDDLLLVQAVADGQGIGLVREAYLNAGSIDSRVVPLKQFAVSSGKPSASSPSPEVAIARSWPPLFVGCWPKQLNRRCRSDLSWPTTATAQIVVWRKSRPECNDVKPSC